MLIPAFLVLTGLSVIMFLRWPVVGACSAALVTLYVTCNVLLASRYVRPANLRSNALDSRIGAALAERAADVGGGQAARFAGGYASIDASGREAEAIAQIVELVRRLRSGELPPPFPLAAALPEF